MRLKSWIIIKQRIFMKTQTINSFAETLKDFLDEMELSQKEVAAATGIPESHLSSMKHGRRRVTPEYDLRLSRYFGMSEGYWLRLQLASDLYNARAAKGSKIKKEVRPLAVA